MAIAYLVYPIKVEDVEPESLLTDAQIRDQFIAKVQGGMAWRVAELEVLSAATGPATKPVRRVKQIVRQIRADINALRAVNALEYDTVQEYVAALQAASQVIPIATWAEYLQDAYDIPPGTAAERFAALKAALSAE